MLGQGEIGVLSSADLGDWREIEALLAAMSDDSNGFSTKERTQARVREWVVMACFYDTYGLDRTKVYEFSPITGSITEPIWEVTMGEAE